MARHGIGEDHEALRDRVDAFIAAYAIQGKHRTGTQVDERSGEWLVAQLQNAVAAGREAPGS